jgi:hypothetical protein
MRYKFLTAFFCLMSNISSGQDTIPKPGMLNFFLDCDRCDFNYIRDELPFVAFVREPLMADVHILVSLSQTASGGRKYFLSFIGLNSLKGTNYEYEVITAQSYTDDAIRSALVKGLKTGLLQYYAKTPFFEDLNIEISESGNRKADALVVDRWDNWVFNVSAGAYLEKEASQNESRWDSEIRARRITDLWKTSFEAEYATDREIFYDDGAEIEDRQNTKAFQGSLIRSLTGKWSAGIFTSYSSMTYLNIKNNYQAGLGIQYNFFPWIECNRRVFSVGYLAGMDISDYIDETIYDKMKESHLAEMLLIELDLVQPWGEIQLGVQGRHYFHDFSKSRLTMEADLSVRLTRNLSVYCDVRSQIIHDQLYLPKGDASLEDILLRRRKLATTYEIRGRFGVRFTFGSIYNNIVNERFDNMR